MYSSLFQLNFSTSYLVICFCFFEQDGVRRYMNGSAIRIYVSAWGKVSVLSVYSLQHDIPNSDL